MSDEQSVKWPPLLTLGAFLLISLLIGIDQVQDFREGVDQLHLGMEGVAMLAALAGATGTIVLYARRARRQREALTHALSGLEKAQARSQALEAEASRWKREAHNALQALGEVIDQQFERWDLSPAEAEVALLLLKGLATKEIAEVRGTSDRTVRQQAQAVYKKAGLGNRAELAAWFLEDLLLPRRPPAEG